MVLSHGPGAFEIKGGVEIAVPGNVWRLNRCQVDPNDKGIRIFVGNIDRPNSGATAQIEKTAIAGVRRIDQPIGYSRNGKELMKNVKAVLFLFVARKMVDSFTVTMI